MKFLLEFILTDFGFSASRFVGTIFFLRIGITFLRMLLENNKRKSLGDFVVYINCRLAITIQSGYADMIATAVLSMEGIEFGKKLCSVGK